LIVERKEFTLSRVAWVRVVGPLGGLFGHGVESTIGGATSITLGEQLDFHFHFTITIIIHNNN
jgi:hypothetical protein